MLFTTAKRGSLAEFLDGYTAADATLTERSGRTLLHIALTNGDPSARVAIAERLLDDGADAVIPDAGLTTLHVLFGNPQHDYEAEAGLVERLLAGGADVNAMSKRAGTPIVVALDRSIVPLSAAAPLMEALIQHSSIDFDVHVQRKGAPVTTLRDRIIAETKDGNVLRRAAEASADRRQR